MKFNKMMFAALAFSALAMFSCKQKPDDPVGPVGPGGGGGGEDPVVEIPEVAAPAAGFATIVINIPANSECNGIAFKGNLNGDWSGEDTYVSETTAKASSADCIKFAPVPKAANWYQATFKMGEDGLKGKVCLIYKGDKDWQGQAINWEIIDDYTTAETSTSDGNLEITAKGGLVYLKIGGWQNSECAKLEAYNLTFLTPAFCGEEFDIEIAGSYNSWGGNPTALKKEAAGKYTATIQAGPGTEFKIRGAGTGDWSREVEGYIKDEDKWTSVPNNVLGTDKNVTIDYSDAEKYRWNVCAGE